MVPKQVSANQAAVDHLVHLIYLIYDDLYKRNHTFFQTIYCRPIMVHCPNRQGKWTIKTKFNNFKIGLLLCSHHEV